MNRQRRAEILAKRKALIDSRIQMLSAQNEIRVPNIIRQRGTAVPQRQRYRPQQAVFSGSFEAAPVTFDASFGGQVQFLESQDMVTIPSPVLNGGVGVPSSAGVGMNFGGEFAFEDGTQIVITSDMVASGQFTSQPLKTVTAEDGTLMVVLESCGDNDNQYKEALPIPGANEIQSTTSVYSGNHAEVEVQDNAQPESQEVPLPDLNGEEDNDASNVVVGEDTYIIIQTPSGDTVLVPSNSFRSGQSDANHNQSQSLLVSDGNDGFVELITSSSEGAVDQYMSISESVETNVKPESLPEVTVGRVDVNQGAKRRQLKQYGRRSKVQRLSKPQLKMGCGLSSSTNCVPQRTSGLVSFAQSTTQAAPQCAFNGPVEKAGPYRFEMPELEEDTETGFISVPIPIQIDSLRSVTETHNMAEQPKKVEVADPEAAAVTIEKCEACQTEFQSKTALFDHIEKLHRNLTTQSLGSEEKIIQLKNKCFSPALDCGAEILKGNEPKPDQDMNANVQDSVFEASSASTPASSDDLVLCANIGNTQLVTDQVDARTGESDFNLNEFTVTAFDNVLEAEKNNFESTGCGKDVNLSQDHVSLQERNGIDADNLTHIKETLGKNMRNSQRQGRIGSQVNESRHFESHATGDSISFSQTCDVNDDEQSMGECVGRRTLFKSTAKASMANDMLVETWESQTIADSEQDSSVERRTSPPANVRARKVRMKALNGKLPNVEEIGVTFRNICEQLVKH